MSTKMDPFIVPSNEFNPAHGGTKWGVEKEVTTTAASDTISALNVLSAEASVKAESMKFYEEDKSINLPRSILFIFPDIWPGPPGFKGPTTVRIFEDNRTVSNGVAVNRSRHARFYLGGYLFWQYNTTPHRVNELETCGVIGIEMSHGNGWREFPFENPGYYRKAVSHFDWLSRPDIDAWLYAYCKRTA